MIKLHWGMTACHYQMVLLVVLTFSWPQLTVADPLPGDKPSTSRTAEQNVSSPGPVYLTLLERKALLKQMMLILPQALKKATGVQFYKQINGFMVPLATLSEQSNPHMFHLMKKTVFRQGPGLSGIPDLRVLLLVNGKQVASAGYYSQIGSLLIIDEQHGTVPKELQEWIIALTKTIFPGLELN